MMYNIINTTYNDIYNNGGKWSENFPFVIQDLQINFATKLKFKFTENIQIK